MSTITFAGNLANEPELRFTPSGRQVVRLTVIENRRRKTEDGSGWEDTEPNVYRVQAWGNYAENITESCSKGDRVVVSGSVRTDRWTDKDSGDARTAQHVVADEVAFSLKFHTVRATKATRTVPANESDESHGDS
jgi:single-strand DNA-binding protein